MAALRIITSLGRIHNRAMVGRFVAETSSNKVEIRSISQLWIGSRSSSTICDSNSMHIEKCPTSLSNHITKRFKKTKNRRSAEIEENNKRDDDEDEEEDEEENPMLMDDASATDGSTITTIEVPSLRLDSFSKVAFKTTRAKIEEAFYKGQILVNGVRPTKKSIDIHQADEIDLIVGVDKEDYNIVHTKKVLVLELPDKAGETGRMKLKIQSWHDLTMEAPK